MTTAVAQKAQVPDIAAQVSYAMRIMGVAPIPRNYELFYEAYIGSNPKLTRELAALGSKATQEELDAIGSQYFGHHHRANVIDGAHDRIVGELEGLLRMLRQEQTSLESYNELLGETFVRINSKNHASADILKNAIGVLTEATGDTISQGREIVENVVQTSREMDVVRKELDEYKRIANTDSLTQLSNRRAFDDSVQARVDERGVYAKRLGAEPVAWDDITGFTVLRAGIQRIARFERRGAATFGINTTFYDRGIADLVAAVRQHRPDLAG